MILQECAGLGGYGHYVLADKDGGDAAILEKHHVDPTDENRNNINDDKAENRVKHHLLWEHVLNLHTDLAERHTWQNQQKYVTVEEH